MGINSLRPRLNRRPFADDIFKCIFLNRNEWILPRISPKLVSEVRINNIPVLVQIMAWRRPGDEPLSEPMLVSLLTHICVTRPRWVNMLLKQYLYIVRQPTDSTNDIYGCTYTLLHFHPWSIFDHRMHSNILDIKVAARHCENHNYFNKKNVGTLISPSSMLNSWYILV